MACGIPRCPADGPCVRLDTDPISCSTIIAPTQTKVSVETHDDLPSGSFLVVRCASSCT